MDWYKKCKNGVDVYKLRSKKQKQLFCVKIGDVFVKENLPWQGFNVFSPDEGKVTNHHHHYACERCGDYFIGVSTDNADFDEKTLKRFKSHVGECAGRDPNNDKDPAVPENEAFISAYILQFFQYFFCGGSFFTISQTYLGLY
jgi:hypothetical protein